MVSIFWKTDTQKLHTISDLADIFRTTASSRIRFARGEKLGRLSARRAKDFDGIENLSNERG
jgi:hypothetical protein